MKTTKTLCEILEEVDKNYSLAEQEQMAFEYLYDLVDHDTYDEFFNDSDFSAMQYLADYFSDNEYKEWLIRWFL